MSTARSAEKKDSQNNIYVKNYIETTERSYLFIYPYEEDNVQTGEKRRISITTRCRKPAAAGPDEKRCVHEIEIQPGDISYGLNSGEEVVIIDLPGEGDLLILGTVEYGYEDDPDVIRLYNEKGKYLGMTRGINLVTRPDRADILTQPFYLKNAIKDDGKYYILLLKEDNEKEYEILVLEKGAKPKRSHFSLTIPDQDMCADWYVEEFTKNGEGLSDLVVKMRGVSCNSREEGIVKYIKCSGTINE